MKSFLATIAFIGLFTVAHAQSDADEKYIAVYTAIQQADNLVNMGQPKQALASLLEAQAQLQQFQRIYPDWNPPIITYRLDDLGKKITAMKATLAAANPPSAIPAAAPATSAQPTPPSPEEQALRARLLATLAENQNLQAKLKEALSSQPAAVDAGELAKAQEEIRALMKENDLLKASALVNKDTNTVAVLHRQLASAVNQYTNEQASAVKLFSDNVALQRNLKQVALRDSTVLDQLRIENDQLKIQLAAQKPAPVVFGGDEITNQLKTATLQLTTLQSTVSVVTLEKSALENRIKQLSMQTDESRVANYEGRIHDLTEQRDDLAKQLADAGKKGSRKADLQQLAALTNEMQTLRARLAVAEAKPLPYTPEEMALFRQTPPQPNANPNEHSIQELPGGTAELVASAQRHFSNHEFDAAEADYQKILDKDGNNALVLANLATIELQENKLAKAEKHITAALAQSPNDAYDLATLGYVKYQEGKYDDALDALSRAAKLDPQNAEIQNYLGVTLSHKGQRVQAEAALRKAIQINPLYAPAQNNLAVVYLNQNPPMAMLARWHYQKALAAGQPRNADLEKLLADKGAPVAAPQ